MEANYLPEGQLLTSAANRDACSSLPMLERAQASGAILEGTALLCDSELNLHIDFPCPARGARHYPARGGGVLHVPASRSRISPFSRASAKRSASRCRALTHRTPKD